MKSSHLTCCALEEGMECPGARIPPFCGELSDLDAGNGTRIRILLWAVSALNCRAISPDLHLINFASSIFIVYFWCDQMKVLWFSKDNLLLNNRICKGLLGAVFQGLINWCRWQHLIEGLGCEFLDGLVRLNSLQGALPFLLILPDFCPYQCLSNLPEDTRWRDEKSIYFQYSQ